MKKTYIAPALKLEIATIESALLVDSLKINEETVTGGWTKESGDWDIWADEGE